MTMIQDKTDTEPCRMMNRGGSEMGTCDCQMPTDCTRLDRPDVSPLQAQFLKIIRDKIEEHDDEQSVGNSGQGFRT